jgi:CRISPR-associated protein Csx3
MVILAGDMSKVVEWHEFARKVGLVVVAEIYSDYHGSEDTVEGVSSDGILRGSVHHLERGEQVSTRPMIEKLAQHLLAL